MRAHAVLVAVALAAAVLLRPAAARLDTAPFRFLPEAPRAGPAAPAAPAQPETLGAWEPHPEEHAARPAARVALVLALRQRRLDELDALFWEVSTPGSPRYGRHATADELADLVAPSEEDARGVLAWLRGAAPCGAAASLARSRDMIRVECPLAEAEALLGARFRAYRHAGNGRVAWRAATEMAAVPDHVRDLVDFVGGANTPLHGQRHRAGVVEHAAGEAPVPTAGRTRAAAAAAAAADDGEDPPAQFWVGRDASAARGSLGSVNVYFNVRCSDGSENDSEEDEWPCTSVALPGSEGALDSVRVRLAWPRGGFTVTLSPEGVPGVSCQQRNHTDEHNVTTASNVCQATVGGGLVPLHTPVTAEIVSRYVGQAGAALSTGPSGTVYCKEDVSPLWLARLYGVPYGTRATGRADNAVGIAEFLKESYSPDDLAQFLDSVGAPPAPIGTVRGPNNASNPGGEASLDVDVVAPWADQLWFWADFRLNAENHEEPFLRWLAEVNEVGDEGPAVWSISYGDVERSLGRDYVKRVDVEFKKMGARGVSVLVSSGDDGSAGYYGRRNQSAFAKACAVSSPEYPASSPYVTSCGATQLSTQHNQACTDRACAGTAEVLCSAATDGVITSGAGFSEYADRPEYQEEAVAGYLERHGDKMPPRGFYRPEGRVVPDWSAYGQNFLVVQGGEYVTLSGTSASTPLLASFVAMWNDVRLSQGRARLGFLNPWIYDTAKKHPEAFFDIVRGDTRCLVRGYGCCDEGFYAGVGYDVASGVGSPRFDVISRLVLDDESPFPGVAVGSGTDRTATSKATHAVSLGVFALVMSLVSVLLVAFVIKRQQAQLSAASRADTSEDGGGRSLLAMGGSAEE